VLLALCFWMCLIKLVVLYFAVLTPPLKTFSSTLQTLLTLSTGWTRAVHRTVQCFKLKTSMVHTPATTNKYEFNFVYIFTMFGNCLITIVCLTNTLFCFYCYILFILIRLITFYFRILNAQLFFK